MIIESKITPSFTKNQRGSFKYHLAHVFSYNMTALNLGCWKFKYLFHDFEKPWLKLILRDYHKVQKFHRTHNKHHLEYGKVRGDLTKCDFEAMVIDWECSRYTKADSPRTASELLSIIKQGGEKDLSEEQAKALCDNMIPILERLGLWPNS